jgi:hypothetical protein
MVAAARSSSRSAADIDLAGLPARTCVIALNLIAAPSAIAVSIIIKGPKPEATVEPAATQPVEAVARAAGHLAATKVAATEMGVTVATAMAADPAASEAAGMVAKAAATCVAASSASDATAPAATAAAGQCAG